MPLTDSHVSPGKETSSIWANRISRWRRYPQRFGRWWWWMWGWMRLSNLPVIGRSCTWLAGLPLKPYKDKWPLARITSNPYISPKAQISCPDLHISPRCFIDDFVTVYSGLGGGKVVLENGVHIHRGTTIDVGHGGQVTIGEETYIQPNCNVNGHLSQVRIGRHVMIAPGCGFFSYQHNTGNLAQPMDRQGLTSRGDIVIEDDVWLGMGVTVMDGVRIGRGAVIGAGAVVTRDIPPYSVAVGVPAQVVRQRGTPGQIQQLTERVPDDNSR